MKKNETVLDRKVRKNVEALKGTYDFLKRRDCPYLSQVEALMRESFKLGQYVQAYKIDEYEKIFEEL